MSFRPVFIAVVVATALVVGVAGFGLHLAADLRQTAPTLVEKVLSGAPPMAPLLFPNLALLGCMGLYALARSD